MGVFARLPDEEQEGILPAEPLGTEDDLPPAVDILNIPALPEPEPPRP